MGDPAFSWWDRFLVSVAPRWGLQRLKSKEALRSYEAAGTGRRTSGWNRSSSDANQASASALAPLREISRDLRRNNAWAKRAIKVISGNVVGRGIVAKPDTEDERIATEAAAVWKQWSGSKKCDFDGRMKFAGVQRLAMDCIVESGEVLIMRETANASDRLPVSLRVRVLEPDFIDTRRHGTLPSGGKVQRGIELDGRGRRVAYWIYDQHPGATGFASVSSTGLTSSRVDAEDILHAYLVDRPGQMRGVPWLCAAISRLQDFGDYEDAKLMQQKVAALFAAFVSDMDGRAAGLGEADADGALLEGFEPGSVQYLKPGQEVTFPNPPSVVDGTFSQGQLRAIAAALGVTYEDLTGDYSQVNFSSARMARLAHYTNVHSWRAEIMIPQICEGVWDWVMEQAASLGGWPSVPASMWTGAPMPMIAPEKEGRAIRDRIRSGLTTLPQALLEQGHDPVAHLAEIAASNQAIDDAEIILDSDPRHTSMAGGAQDALAIGDAPDAPPA